MVNMLAWLTGRDDQTGQPSPLQYDDGPSLRAYNPSPSEAFGNWISDALGAGPSASLAHQAFAKGVPSVLSLFPPLGVGLSAADLLHAKAAGDPAGAAAAAIGMIPAVGGEARVAANEVTPIVKKKAGEYGSWLEQQLVSGRAKLPSSDTDVALSAIHEALNPGAPLPDWMKQTSLPSKDGYTLSSAANKDFPESAKDYFVHDPAGKKVGELSHVEEVKHDDVSSIPAHWQLDMEGVAPKGGSSLDGLMQYIPGWHKHTLTEQPKKLTDFNPKGLAVGPSSPYSPSIPYADSTTFQDFGAFPSKVPFQPSETAAAQGYVTPAVHGTKVGPAMWKAPSGGPIGESGDALRLPADELGVHFGTPDQAKEFTGNQLSSSSYVMPRTYPTVLQTGKSLELPDTGVWHVGDIKTALLELNKGKSPGGQFALAEPKAHVGEFPAEEHANISTIEELRNYLQDKGYDSVNYINRVEGRGQRSYIMFKPSPEAPDYAAGVRSPFAAFDLSKMLRPELGLGIAGLLGAGTAMAPSESKAASPRGPHISDVMDTINSVFPATAPLPLQGTAR